MLGVVVFFFFSSRRRHTRCSRDWSSDVCSSDLRRVLRACANIACPSWLAIARAPQPSRAALAAETVLPNVGLLPAYRPGILRDVARSYDPLAMTGRATGQLGGCPNLSFLHEFLAQFLLIGSRFPIHRKYLVH